MLQIALLITFSCCSTWKKKKKSIKKLATCLSSEFKGTGEVHLHILSSFKKQEVNQTFILLFKVETLIPPMTSGESDLERILV